MSNTDYAWYKRKQASQQAKKTVTFQPNW